MRKVSDYNARKRVARDYAKLIFKDKKVTLTNADALLIYYFAKMKITNDMNWIKNKLNEVKK